MPKEKQILNANEKKWASLKNQRRIDYQIYVDDGSDHWFGTVNLPEELSWQDMPGGLIINGFRYRLELE